MEKYNPADADLENQEVMDDIGLGEVPGTDGNEVCADANVAEEAQPAGDITAGVNEEEQWRDKYLRLSAEFDNYRKRTLREKLDLVTTGGEDIIRVMLPVFDDLDRALEAMRKSDDIESARTGITLVSKKIHEVLASKGLSEIEAVGQPLDTDLHEAIAKIPVQDKKQRGKVVDVVQKGYRLKDKVVRHAKCVVGE